MNKKKLIIINGTMGVGKTTVSRSLYKNLARSFWLDGDSCWHMNPFIVNEENKNMVIENICFILNNFIKNSLADYIIFNWVIQTDEIMNFVLDNLNLKNTEVYKITLMCSEEYLVQRIIKDIGDGIRSSESIKRSLDNLKLYNRMDTIKVNTDNKSIDSVVQEIIEIVGSSRILNGSIRE
ncbi:AAA family ATPase [uncultured Clostridium sp.]|uniref:AAA family ATPase n=1 Tax=uncultured Clostridium sp. TaxID=59620 RepID=UPI0025E104ED|nr:AAA family ATPase [uncultured Clostridium sp.]